MSAFHPLELLGSYPHYLFGEAGFPEPRFASYHCPLACAVESADDYLASNYGILNPSPIHVDFPCRHCLHFNQYNHHHHHHHPFPPIPYVATDLLPNTPTNPHWHKCYSRCLGDRLTPLELRLGRLLGDPCIDSPGRTWKWAAEIKGMEGNRFDREYKCTVESKGAFEKSVKWTVEFQGKGRYEPLSRTYGLKFHSDSAATREFCEKSKGKKKDKGAVARQIEIDEEEDQILFSVRQASLKRSAHRSKGKKKEQSPQDAAMAIQRTFRDYRSRRSRALHCLRDLANVKSKLRELRKLFASFSYRHRLEKDAEERQRFSEKIIVLLLTVDAIEGSTDVTIRSAKRSIINELESMLDMVDSRLMGRRQFDLPVGSSTQMASGVADVVHMLDQDDGSSILPIFAL